MELLILETNSLHYPMMKYEKRTVSNQLIRTDDSISHEKVQSSFFVKARAPIQRVFANDLSNAQSSNLNSF